MRYKPERALTQEDYLELDMLLSCNNEVQAREGIDTPSLQVSWMASLE